MPVRLAERPWRSTAAAVAVLAGLLASLTTPAAAVDVGLTLWAPPAQAEVIRDQLADGFRGQTVSVVEVPLEDIRRQLATVGVDAAPDVIWADAAWTGQLARDHMVKRLPLSAALSGQSPSNLRAAFRYGFGDYGLPVTVAGDALVVNLELVGTAPTTFGQLERQATQLVDSGKASVGIAVGQGGPGDEHLLGPLFTGLGGYLFGSDPAGGLDPYNVGLATTDLLANAERVDDWREAGLLAADLTPQQAQRTFAAGRAPFWITDPSSAPVIAALPFDTVVQAVPRIVKGISATPLLAVEGPMVTVYADRHGVGDLAAGLVRRHFGSARTQAQIARATLTAPAASEAVVSAPVSLFAVAAAGGRPLPNIPQAAAVLTHFRRAWAQATSGAAGTGARDAFADAQRAVIAAVG